MNFIDKMKILESAELYTYAIKKGSTPVILTAPHTMQQKKKNGKIKFSESMTKAIAKYVSTKTDSCCFVKIQDTGVDPNRRNNDEFKKILIDLIESNNIKLLIDVHGAKKERDFDVEIGNLDGLSASDKTISKLVASLTKCGVRNICFNDPFKGGDITKKISSETNAEVIQIEVNGNFRSIHNSKDLKKICRALVDFINTNYRKSSSN